MQMVKLRGFDHYTLLSRLLHAARENNPPKRMPPAMFRLDGDVAIVTGAGSRIPGEIGNGRAAAILLARQGCRVALVDYNTAWAQETKDMIDQEGGTSEVVQCDVTREESCQAAVAKTVELFGAVHILVNIVGVGGPHGDVTHVDLEAWDRDFRLNVTSMVMMARHAIPEMRKTGSGGRIVNMSSVSGLLGGNPGVLYPTTKGAIIQLTRAMAAHHGPENIRVNCAPGMVYTPMSSRGGTMDPELRQKRVNQNLLRLEGTGWDVGYAIVYLCSREARWITGVILPVDAGTTAGNPNRPALKEDSLASASNGQPTVATG